MLNAHAFSQPFTAVRGSLPTFELPQMNALRVTVVPKEDDGRLDTRSSSAHDYAIDIGIQKKPESIEAVVATLRKIQPDILGLSEMGSRRDLKDLQKRLRAAGVDSVLDVVAGAPHGFEKLAANTRLAQDYLARARGWLGAAVTPAQEAPAAEDASSS